MTAYYNEIDPFAAAWLRQLISAGHIAPGDVDERSIADVKPDDLKGYTQCHFFAGLGGWSYALRLAGWPDGRRVWPGSCPCQPFSFAGKRTGFDDPRHLWPFWKNLIEKCEPAVVFGEQVATATEWLGLVHRDLEALGRAVAAIPIEAASAGAPHRRDRYWFVTDTERHEQSWEEPRSGADRRMGREQQLLPWDGGWPAALARFRIVDHGLSRRVEGTDAARNAIVPQVAAAFIEAYLEITPERIRLEGAFA